MSEKRKRGEPQSVTSRTSAARPGKASERLAAAPTSVAAASDASPVEGRPPELTARIRERAYLLYESCGCRWGHELDHWLDAERELTPRQEPSG